MTRPKGPAEQDYPAAPKVDPTGTQPDFPKQLEVALRRVFEQKQRAVLLELDRMRAAIDPLP